VDKTTLTASDLWSAVSTEIRSVLNEQTYATWFEPISAVGLDAKSITLEVPSKFYYEWIDRHYRKMLLSKIKAISGKKLIVRYSVVLGEPQKKETNGDNAIEKSIDPNERFYDSGSRLNKRYTFTSFVEGSNNQLAKAASVSVADSPGQTSFNPLVIYGGVGLGKTHLLQAIGNKVLIRKPAPKVHYTTSEKFTLDFISAIQNNNSSNFSTRYRNVDVLLVDDIQFLQKKEQTQEQFFHTFNDLYQRGKQVILTMDRHPSELYGLKDRLLSRFQSGLIVDVQAPNLETRIAILQKKAADDSLEIPFEITELIATNVRGNIREMEGALIKLLAYSSLSHTDITMSLAKRALRETLGRSGAKSVSIDDVIQSVSESLDVPENKLIGRGRKMEVANARQVAMYLSREVVGASLENIGLHFGGRDHTTVIHACRSVKGKMNNKSDFQRQVDGIRSQLEF
tara:strand:+ start:34053 stop:35417 length:1365 start_codon:yes stop_codon:yes gene_type:complete